MSKKIMFGLLALALVAVLAPAALAQVVPDPPTLVAIGPINPLPAPGNGFPQWVQDVNGVRTDLPNPPIGTAINGDPLQVIIPPTMTFEEPTNNQFGFGPEAFYYLCETAIDTLPPPDPTRPDRPGLALMVLGVEAAWNTASGNPANGQQMLFTRLRLRIDTTVAGDYTVTHPWGVQVFTNVPAGRRGINSTVDTIGLTPDFTPIVTSSTFKVPFMRGTLATTVPPIDPTLWIGDGVTLGPITGGVNDVNVFRIDGPANAFGPGVNFVETPNFLVSGHIVPGPPPPPPPVLPGTPTPLTLDQAAFAATNAGGNVDVFATSNLTATVTVSLDGGAPVAMAQGLPGKFFVRIPILRGAVVPVLATVTANDTVVPGYVPATLEAELTDAVTITSAIYTRRNSTLVIRARSSNRVAPLPVLTAPGFGDLVRGVGRFTGVLAPPLEVTVISTSGGRATLPVTIR